MNNEKRRKGFGYARLSKDDGSRYSSIESQIQLIKDYAKNKNIELVHIYIDDNVSGFIDIEDRPQFYEMLERIAKKDVNVIIAKDLSRIGRKNGSTQMLLDSWKNSEINLLLIQEMGREFNLLEDDDDLIGLSTWWNERYIKDLSKKVKTGMNVRQKQGILVQGFKYGYVKDQHIKGNLKVDEELRGAIETIFNLYEQGYGMKAICSKLNKEYNFLTPSESIEKEIKSNGKTYKKTVKRLWDMYMVSRILKDDLYIGNLRTHKAELKTIKGNAIKIPKQDQYLFENHHEAIITKEQFERVQDIIETRHKQTSSYKRGKNDYIFGGFIVCGECGYAGTGVAGRIRTTTNDRYKYYDCTIYRKYGKERCSSHRIGEEYLLQNFKEFLKQLRKEYKEILDGIVVENVKKKSKINIEKLNKDLKTAKQEYKNLQKEKINQLLNNNKSQDIINETFEELEKEVLAKIEKLEGTLTRISNENTKTKTENIKKAIDYFDVIINSTNPDKAILREVLDKIIVYKDKSIEFVLKISIDKLV